MNRPRIQKTLLISGLALTLGTMITISPMEQIAMAAVEEIVQLAAPHVEKLSADLLTSLAAKLGMVVHEQGFENLMQYAYTQTTPKQAELSAAPQDATTVSSPATTNKQAMANMGVSTIVAASSATQHTKTTPDQQATSSQKTQEQNSAIALPTNQVAPAEAASKIQAPTTAKELAQAQVKLIAQRYIREQGIASPEAHMQRLQQDIQQFKHPYTVEQTAYGTSIRTNDRQASLSLEFRLPKEVPLAVLQQEEAHMQKALAAHLTYSSPVTASHYHALFRTVLNTLTAVESTNFKERVRACLDINTLHCNAPFYDELENVKQDLRKAYFDADGTLRDFIVDSNNARMATYVTTFIQQSPLAKSFRKLVLDDNRLHYKAKNLDRLHGIRQHLGKKIATNARNQIYKELLAAGDACDMQTVTNIQTHYPHDRIIQKLANQYKEKFKHCVYDTYGIVTSCINDPLYTNLSAAERTHLVQNPASFEAFNEKLLARKAIKEALQEQWHIADNAAALVHTTLYKALEDMPHFFETITQAVHAASGSDYKALIEAFYLPNGIMKEIARQIPEAATLQFPACITRKDQTAARDMIHYALCHVGGLVDHAHRAEAYTTINYLRAYLTSTNQEEKEWYKNIGTFAYNQLQQIEQPSITLPAIDASYTNRQQRETHQLIISTLANLVHRQQKITQKQGAIHNHTITAFFAQHYAQIKQAHELNQAGKPEQAQLVLANELGIPVSKLGKNAIHHAVKKQCKPVKKLEKIQPQSPQGPEWEPEDKNKIQKKADAIRKKINNDPGILDAMEKNGGHTLEKHVSKTNEELIKRAAKESVEASTSFTNKSTALKAIKENINQNVQEIARWLTEEADGAAKKAFEATHTHTIGKGTAGGRQQVISAHSSRIILMKDATSELGFTIVTAFPIL